MEIIKVFNAHLGMFRKKLLKIKIILKIPKAG